MYVTFNFLYFLCMIWTTQYVWEGSLERWHFIIIFKKNTKIWMILYSFLNWSSISETLAGLVKWVNWVDRAYQIFNYNLLKGPPVEWKKGPPVEWKKARPVLVLEQGSIFFILLYNNLYFTLSKISAKLSLHYTLTWFSNNFIFMRMIKANDEAGMLSCDKDVRCLLPSCLI